MDECLWIHKISINWFGCVLIQLKKWQFQIASKNRNLYQIESVEFQENSQLEIIGTDCFGSSLFEKIIVPSNVTQICDNAFNNCNRLKKIKFEQNSNLQSIGNLAFTMTSINILKLNYFLIFFLEEIENKYQLILLQNFIT